MAANAVFGSGIFQGRFGLVANFDGERTARRKDTAFGQSAAFGQIALDGPQATVPSRGLNAWYGAEEAQGVGMQRLLKQISSGGVFHDFTRVHYGDTPAQLRH